ncbi:hypothetical protein GHT06_022249 [Daphnia sinensis]|uniref:Uncharacterized protein n=1 Tax=Daphnia sinensis TaxID=1820382 RepID=A0AAD5PMD2_9CRUS|nr:hypothetical protein GHT06_022249 [Daphnia sinensis]
MDRRLFAREPVFTDDLNTEQRGLIYQVSFAVRFVFIASRLHRVQHLSVRKFLFHRGNPRNK